MKKSLLGILAVGVFATAANAATLSMRFAGGGNEVTLGPSDSVTVEVVITMGVNDGPKTPSKLTGIDMRFDVGGLADGGFGPYVLDGGQDDKLAVTDVSSPIGAWSNAASILGSFDRLGFFMSVGDPAGTTGVTGTGAVFDTVIATFVIHKAFSVLPPGPATDTYFVWRNEDPLPALYNGPATWGNKFGYTVENGRNQFLHGQGSPGDADPRYVYHGYETMEPLIIHQIPEPSAIALMVLGGLAALRRRK
jgi:hypothetical protein